MSVLWVQTTVMNMKGARLFLLAISVFALCGWAVLLGGKPHAAQDPCFVHLIFSDRILRYRGFDGAPRFPRQLRVVRVGVAALEHDCNNLPGSLADYARANNNPEAASIFQGISNYNDQYNFGVAPRCARQFGLQWFLICIYVAIIIGSIACAFSHVAARHMALTWAFLLATVTALFWIFCQRYDTINWSLSNVDTPLWRALGGIKSALRCVLAGKLLSLALPADASSAFEGPLC